MRFWAGLFFQIPALSLLYTNPEFEVNPQSNSTQFGNAGLKPERTASFEVGLQQGLTSDIGIEVTLFVKDVRNLTGQQIARTPRGDFVIRWVNTDYGTIRGFTLSTFRRVARPVGWTLDYTFQFADGTASDPGEAFGRQQSGLDEIVSLTRLNWDRRHVLNGTVTVVPVDGLDITFVARLRSGEPYTTVRNFARSVEPNNADRPWQFFSDLRIFYRPPFIKQDIAVFLQVENLFDNKAVFAVYETTGRADESFEQEQFRTLAVPVRGVNSLNEFYYNQGWFSRPRRLSLGLSVRL
jgi:outer membrane receptor protein involved in Fe transport